MIEVEADGGGEIGDTAVIEDVAGGYGGEGTELPFLGIIEGGTEGLPLGEAKAPGIDGEMGLGLRFRGDQD